ncbi:MAG: type III-A CRISPR-associated protein Cas10/Csm1, partial [Planctomycetes bacterium]|nr:type III-A CRISPR-associated protein Cas10/Csm1 [Planctomycetota bacterium]
MRATMDRMEYQTVVLAALLHDVGKYFQRGALGLAGQHPQLGADFVSAWRDRFAQCVNADVLRTLVQKHHEGTVDGIADGHTRALARLISHADHFSAAERTERAIAFQDFRTTALAPTFVHVRLLSDKSPEDCRLAHSELGRAHEEPPIFPQPGRQAPEHEVNEHIRAFGAAFTELADRLNWKDFPTVYAHLLSLLHRFTWCIASDTQTDPPDLSLYDHLRVTSAIAACLYRFHAEGGTLDDGTLKNPPPQRCAVLVGDLSGIQGYLYHIATVGAGGVARRLRARSFGLQMLAEVASLKVLHAFDLPLANVLMASGGKFYVLLPNLPTASETLTALQRDSDKWLLASFHGELALSLAWMPVADRQFGTGAESGGFSQVLRELYPRLRDQKQRRLHGVLTDARGWQESEFLRPPFPADRSACPSCHRFPAEFTIAPDDPEDKEVCQKCFDDAQLGSRLTRAEFVGFYDRAERGSACLGWTVCVADDPHALPPNPALVARLNSSDLSHVPHVPAKFAFLTNYVPREDDGKVKPFETIAGEGPLAVIKADVDHLGQVFQDGLRRDAPPSFDTPSRIASLSRQMDYFFSGWMQWLLESEFPGFYAVYSGGDDLLLVGPMAE